MLLFCSFKIQSYDVSQKMEAISTKNTTRKWWTLLWRLNIPNKGKIFLWSCYQEIIPTAVNLAGRGINCSPICRKCEGEEESSIHALFRCKWIKKIGKNYFCWKCMEAFKGRYMVDFLVYLAGNLNKSLKL